MSRYIISSQPKTPIRTTNGSSSFFTELMVKAQKISKKSSTKLLQRAPEAISESNTCSQSTAHLSRKQQKMPKAINEAAISQPRLNKNNEEAIHSILYKVNREAASFLFQYTDDGIKCAPLTDDETSSAPYKKAIEATGKLGKRLCYIFDDTSEKSLLEQCQGFLDSANKAFEECISQNGQLINGEKTSEKLALLRDEFNKAKKQLEELESNGHSLTAENRAEAKELNCASLTPIGESSQNLKSSSSLAAEMKSKKAKEDALGSSGVEQTASSAIKNIQIPSVLNRARPIPLGRPGSLPLFQPKSWR